MHSDTDFVSLPVRAATVPPPAAFQLDLATSCRKARAGLLKPGRPLCACPTKIKESRLVVRDTAGILKACTRDVRRSWQVAGAMTDDRANLITMLTALDASGEAL
jgi:hypothetical protein